jgi:hypothetical protein
VPRRVRDLAVTVIGLVVLCVMLVSINPRLRERTAQVVADPQWDSLRGTVTHAAVSSLSVVHGYADGHSYLFTFLVAACLFVFLMLKVI